MAFITLSGTLLDPNGDLAVGDQIRFTHKSTTGETVQSAVSIITVNPAGTYSLPLQYGLVLVEYKDVRTQQFKNLGVATVNGSNPATSIPELLNALVPVSSAELIEFQAILADCVAAQTAAENAATTAEAFAYQLTTTDLIASTATFAAATNIPTSGFTTSGDGGNGSWKQNGLTGQAPSQSPAQLGDALLNDGNGNQWALVSNGNISAESLGVQDSLVSDSTLELKAALDSFGVVGGIVTLNPKYRTKVTNIIVPDNVTLTSGAVYRDQDEGATVAYDSFWGGLFCDSLVVRDGGAITNTGIVNKNLIGVSRPTTDGEASAIVSNFTGTAISLSGTGTTLDNLVILGFTNAVVDNGNRHDINKVRFDCTNGIEVGGGSDITRVRYCHGWPYITSEMGLSSSVNYRSGVAYLLENNNDTYALDHNYCFGYEVGYRLLGQSGQVVQSPQLSFNRADSGIVGNSGTSIGFDVGNFCAQVLLNSCQAQNYDRLIAINTQGANTGGGERLNNVDVYGGTWMSAKDKFFQINNGYVTFTNLQIAKESTSTACFDWNTSDGGTITSCKFEEMYETSGDGLIFDPASAAISANVKRQFNKQASNINVDNRMQDTQPSIQKFSVATSTVPDGTGRVNITHELGRTPSWAMTQIRGDNTTACNVISVDLTNIVVQLYNKATGADVTTGTHDIIWEVKDHD